MRINFPIFGPIILLVFVKPSSSAKGCTIVLRNRNSTMKRAVCNMPNYILKSIPLDLPEILAELDISFQNIREIYNKEFIHLPNLEILSITSSNVQTIHEGAFIQLSKLKVLTLSNNSLIVSSTNYQSLSKYIFLPLLDLKIIDLSQNFIGNIPDFFFNHVNQTLEELKLSHSKTEIVLKKNSLMHLGVLKTLSLEYSQMTTLENDLEDSLNLMINLREIIFIGNLWNCNCSIKWFTVWVRKKFNLNKKLNEKYDNFLCQSPPSLKNRNILQDTHDLLKENELKCIPEPMTSNSTISQISGQNISIPCIFKNLDNEQIIRWKYKDYIFTNKIIDPRITVVETKGKYRKSILTIKNISKVEDGIWECFVNFSNKPIAIQFRILVESYHTSSPDLQTKNATVYILVSVFFIIFFIIIFFILIYYFKYYKRNLLSTKNQTNFNIFPKKKSKNHFYKNICQTPINPFSISKDSIKIEEKTFDNGPISSGFYINFTKKKNEQNFSTLNCLDCQNYAIVDERINNNFNNINSSKSKSPRFWYLDDTIDGMDYLPTSVPLEKNTTLSDISEYDSAFITRIPSRTPCPVHSAHISVANLDNSDSDTKAKKLKREDQIESCPVHGKRNLPNSYSVHFNIPEKKLNKSSINTLYSLKSKKDNLFPNSSEKSKPQNYFPVYLSPLEIPLKDNTLLRQYSCLTNSVV